MISGWHNKLGRVSRMSWEEIQTRAGQELHKQADLLRHRIGIPPASIKLRESATTGAFFFTAGETEARADLIRRHLPEESAEMIREADAICEHRFRLLGYENLDFSAGKNNEIDWHLDPVHGKRAPLDPWPKIPFLEFDVVGDHKVTWELNRHQHLVTLVKAWRLTHNAKYVDELIVQWRSWVKANPYPLGINWASTLEIAFRSLSWIWVDRLLSGEARYSEFRDELLPVLAFHGRYIERYLSTYFSPNTHLLGEAVALFFLGTLYPQMPHASRWAEQGWEIVVHEAGRQVRPDGVYFEQSLHYHVYALDFFLHARALAAAHSIAISVAFDETLQKMLNVVEALAQAGPAEGFGDDDGGRVFNPRRNRNEHMTDPLALGALAYNRDDLAAAELTEESIWLFGERAIEKLARPRTQLAAASAAFSDGGIYVLADTAPGSGDSQPFPQALMIDAGPQGVGRCGHGHADALSVRLIADGARWLVDSGTGVYISGDPKERNAFRGTEAHNTMLVDRLDQATPGDPFSWTDIPTTRAENWVAGKTFTYFVGSHNGYDRLADPVTHRRSILCVNGSTDSGIWFVRDQATGKAEHDVAVNWHFAPGLSVREAGQGNEIVAQPNSSGAKLRMVLPEESPWKTSISQGLVSPAYGRYEPAPAVRCQARAKLPAELVTAFILQAGSSQKRACRLVSNRDQFVHTYQLQIDSEESRFLLFAIEGGKWTSGPFSSDAELLYCRVSHEKLIQVVMISGSTLEWQGQPLLSAGRELRYFEWRAADGIKECDPAGSFTTRWFDELARVTSEAANQPSSFAEKL